MINQRRYSSQPRGGPPNISQNNFKRKKKSKKSTLPQLPQTKLGSSKRGGQRMGQSGWTQNTIAEKFGYDPQ